MGNGIADTGRLVKLMIALDKVNKIKKTFGAKCRIIKIDQNIQLEYKDMPKMVYVVINGNKYVKYLYGTVGLTQDFATGITLGMLKSGLSFVTKDKRVANKEYADKIAKKIEDSLKEIEKEFRMHSLKNWETTD